MKQPTSTLEKENQHNPFSGPEILKVINTTQAQEEIWTACKLGGDDANKAYNESISLKLKGKLNLAAIQKAFQTLIIRHESLRSVFSTNGLFMTIFKELSIPILYDDISKLSSKEKEKVISNYLKQHTGSIFDLVKGPLIKASIIKISDFEHRLILTAHHIICDGWSIGIILQELGILYSANEQNTPPEISIPDDFSIYADEQQMLIESKEYKEIEQFWINKYKEPITPLLLPNDFPYPLNRTYKSMRYDFILNKNLLNALKKTGLHATCSLVTSLLSVFEIFLFKLTGQEDLVIGLPAAGQAVNGMTQLVGHCANLLPLRAKINRNSTFTDYLKQRKIELFDAYDHQQLSFGHLLQKLSISRDPSRVPLAPVVFNVDLGMTDGVYFHNLTYELINNARQYEIFEIFLNASGNEENLVFEWSYNSALFKQDTIKQMMISFENLIEDLVYNPNKSLSEIINNNYLDIYNTLNDTETVYPLQNLHELLKTQANSTPNNIAIEYNETKTTYKDLHRKTNQLTHYLLNQGIKPGDFVGVSLSRGPELIITLISILQCGAAYVPLDPKYPQDRLDFMLEDSETKFLITNNNLSFSFPDTIKQIFIEDALIFSQKLSNATPLKNNISQDNIAYLLYTSGSTGKPKGVPVTHRNLINLLFSITNEPGINEMDRFLAITTISFDIAEVELFLPLLNGACVVMTDTETARDGRLLLNLLQSKKITILQATPTTWKMLLEANWQAPLKLKAFCGGEALSLDLAKKLLLRCDSLWNMYGPTETTIYSIIKQIKKEDDIICIGKPIANTQAFLLNSNNELVPPGKVGEIAIAGHGVAQGYLKRQNLTEEKFIPNKFSKSIHNKKLYLTGDLGKLLPTGDILCLGRSDQQVKIRGHRIELGEIEQTLATLDDVKSVVVLNFNDSLIAFVVPIKFDDVNHLKINEWKKHLINKLPSHLIPHDFRIIKKLPYTPNNKLDRNKLLESETLKIQPKISNSHPRTATEKMVASIWEKYLNLDEINIFSNFFELGGHSLIALKVMNRLEKETGKNLPLSSLFEYSTVEKFSKLLDINANIDYASSLVPIKPKGNKSPVYLIHGAGLEVMIFNILAENLDKEQPVYALQAKELLSDKKKYNTVEEIATHYVETIIKAYPTGPYTLAGYSFGGIIAYEMALQLKAKNKKVNMVGLFDTIIEPHFIYKSPIRKKIALFNYRTKRQIYFFKEMIKSWENFKFHINRKKEFVLNQYFKNKKFKNDEDKLEYEHFLETESIIQPIKNRYQLIPQNFEVDLFRAKDDTSYTDDPIYHGWKKIALKGVNVHDIPGNHDNIFSNPHKKEVGRIFQNVLDLRNENI